MTKQEKKAGWIAGASLVLMAIAAGFSYGYVLGGLVSDSAEITFKNITDNRLLFLAGLAGWVVIFITDIIVAAGLYLFFKRTNKRISLLTAAIRIIYTIFLGFAISRLFAMVPVFSGRLSATDLQRLLDGFEKTWSLGLIIFGFHLVGLGFLSLKNKSVPRFFGYLLYFAGMSYTLLNVAKNFSSISVQVINQWEVGLSLPMALGEILLALWLIYFAVRNKADKI
jgi:hypothetical protein